MCSDMKCRFLILFVVNSLFNCAYGQSSSRYSIIIDEILADPTPVIGLPNTEFIELKNVSGVAIDLFHWKITDGSSTATIPNNYILQPDSFLVICPTSAAISFSSFGPVMGVANFPSLNNDRDVIILSSS